MSKILKTTGLLLIVGLAASTGYLGYRYRQLHTEKATLLSQLASTTKELSGYKSDPNAVAQAEARKVIEEVSKVYSLPKDETPQIAKVNNDKAKLEQLRKDQVFFAKAEENDITLIYAQAKIAILYRPSTKQIINVSSVTIQSQQTPATTP